MKGMSGAALALVAVLVLAAGCGGSSSSGGSATLDKTPVTITVWDYYGSATPVKPAIAGFEKKYPWITVKYVPIDWDTEHEKFTVVVSSGDAPDVATLDMTWIPVFASNGLLADLSELSGGKLNGKPVTSEYTKGALDAMTYNGKYVTMMFDFDTYAMYYRSDLFRSKGIAVPKTWDELRQAAAKLAEDSNGDGTPDKYLLELDPDTFHFSQYLFENGGSLLSSDSTKAAFQEPAGVEALTYYKSFLDDHTGVYWGPAQGDRMAGVKDGRIGMFMDGPYVMGLLQDGAPEMKGKWAVATAPYSKQPGSYLGGTGLSIPVNAPHKAAAWAFVQYMLQLKQQLGVASEAGAAPATTAALQSPQLSKPNPYFGSQAPFPVFLKTMSTASHFPYVKQWDAIDTSISDAVGAALLGKKSPQQALDDAAGQVDDKLASG